MDIKEQITIRGTVTRVFCAKPHWSAGKLKPAGDHSEVSFAGRCFVNEGDIIAFKGQWTTHEKFGRQFDVSSVHYDECLDAAGLAMWLAKNSDAVGIGPTKARRIAEEYSTDFLNILEKDPAQIAMFARVPIENIDRLAKAWLKDKEKTSLATKLAAWGLSKNEIDTLIAKYGPSVISLLQTDPYLSLGEMEGFGFKRIDDIAQKVGFSRDHPSRIKAGLVWGVKQEIGEGSTCSGRDELLDTVEDMLALDRLDGKDTIIETLDLSVVDGKTLGRLEVEGDTYYTTPLLKRCEDHAFRFFRSNGPNHHFRDCDLESLANRDYADVKEDESQRRAVELALRNRICFISGGAGTGKTTIIRTLVDIYRSRFQDQDGRPVFMEPEDTANNDPFDDDFDDEEERPQGSRIALCAPTGKAARRLEEVTGFPTTTIHRLLCYRGAKFLHDDKNPLNVDVVIVDEVSMLDSILAHSLFRSLMPGTALVLVGDHHQLPPVGPGSLLRDIIKHKIAPIAMLENCHRQAGVLKQSCHKLIDGLIRPTSAKDPCGYAPWIVHDRLESPEAILECIERLFREILGEKYGFVMPWDVQFMSPIHKGPIGTRAINVMLQRLYQKTLEHDVMPTDPEKPPILCVGDKVIMTKNNYDLNVMNGHQGQVVGLSPLVVSFDARHVEIPHGLTNEIELSYCLTPHKMQGSEIPVAVTVCHRSHSFMLNRNWLYTACTRARKLNILLGDETGIRQAAGKIAVNRRKTWLGLLAKQA